jgi:hypothetical protein
MLSKIFRRPSYGKTGENLTLIGVITIYPEKLETWENVSNNLTIIYEPIV